jgi:hypothetical protein
MTLFLFSEMIDEESTLTASWRHIIIITKKKKKTVHEMWVYTRCEHVHI